MVLLLFLKDFSHQQFFVWENWVTHLGYTMCMQIMSSLKTQDRSPLRDLTMMVRLQMFIFGLVKEPQMLLTSELLIKMETCRFHFLLRTICRMQFFLASFKRVTTSPFKLSLQQNFMTLAMSHAL
ncbi:hypothetical protein HOLleu_37058 [Holothuria leucospilota]|uniref:Uncharacterized protein n=1 Tax=Holothuria leucospilota TaxID=206669 RepID=A0A9Q0YKV4_HOLLE|nr:hypothetical protein HOLleu_37058 [Holothuria leucospilota]